MNERLHLYNLEEKISKNLLRNMDFSQIALFLTP